MTRTGPSDLDQATGEGEATLRANVREHIEQVLREAGHSESEIRPLRADGVIGKGSGCLSAFLSFAAAEIEHIEEVAKRRRVKRYVRIAGG